MNLGLQNLCNEYQLQKNINPKLYIFDNVETLKYNNIYKDGLDLELKMILANNSYKIIFMISKIDDLILSYQIEESLENICDHYDNILKDLKELEIEEFISIYCSK